MRAGSIGVVEIASSSSFSGSFTCRSLPETHAMAWGHRPGLLTFPRRLSSALPLQLLQLVLTMLRDQLHCSPIISGSLVIWGHILCRVSTYLHFAYDFVRSILSSVAGRTIAIHGMFPTVVRNHFVLVFVMKKGE